MLFATSIRVARPLQGTAVQSESLRSGEGSLAVCTGGQYLENNFRTIVSGRTNHGTSLISSSDLRIYWFISMGVCHLA